MNFIYIGNGIMQLLDLLDYIYKKTNIVLIKGCSLKNYVCIV